MDIIIPILSALMLSAVLIFGGWALYSACRAAYDTLHNSRRNNRFDNP